MHFFNRHTPTPYGQIEISLSPFYHFSDFISSKIITYPKKNQDTPIKRYAFFWTDLRIYAKFLFRRLLMNLPNFQAIGVKEPTKIAKMNTGSCSVNYYIRNEDGEFLIKLIAKSRKDQKDRLLNNLKHTHQKDHCPHLLFKKDLPDAYALVFEWIDGSSYFLEKLPPDTFRQVISAYLDFSQTINRAPIKGILPAATPAGFYAEIKKRPFFLKKEFAEIQQDLSYHPKMQTIHGDFHYKNILFKGNKLQSFLDFENLRHGCPTEDLLRLILTNADQHKVFRTGFTVKLLRLLMQNTPYSRADWLYGLNKNVLRKYVKKLKKYSFCQALVLFRCHFLHRRLRQEINAYFDKRG